MAATLMLLAAAVLVPSQADARCGDYVMIGSHRGGHHGSPLANGGQHGQTGEEGTQDSQGPTCHGPGCSNNSIPPLVPAPKIEVPAERWAIPGGEFASLLPNRDDLLADAHDVPCDGFGLSILRPPR